MLLDLTKGDGYAAVKRAVRDLLYSRRLKNIICVIGLHMYPTSY